MFLTLTKKNYTHTQPLDRLGMKHKSLIKNNVV